MSESRTSELMGVSLGDFGSKSITGTSAVTPATGKTFTAIQAISNIVVSAQTDKGTSNMDLTDFTTILAGTVVFGKWSSITLSSGEAIGYYG